MRTTFENSLDNRGDHPEMSSETSPTTVKFASKLRFRLALFLTLSLLGCLALFLFFAASYRDSLIEAKKAESRRLVTIAVRALEPILERERRGALSRDAAIAEARALLATFVYDDEATRNYLFMSDYRGRMLVQPFEPNLEGSDQWDMRDSAGGYPIRELVAAARAGGGFVAYRHRPPPDGPSGGDGTEPGLQREQAKISYVLPLEPLGVYVGTGFYVDELGALVARRSAPVLALGAGIVCLLLAVFAAALLPFFNAYGRLRAAFGGFAASGERGQVPPPLGLEGLGRDTEARRLLADFNRMTERLAAFEAEERLTAEALARENAEKRVLLGEIHHRVKNNLQIVSSLMNLQIRTKQEESCLACLSDGVARIRSMAAVHELLYESGDFSAVDFSAYAERLVSSAASAAGRGFRVDLELDHLRLGLDQAIPCGLFLNEALTNAFKYGASSSGSDRITVRLGSSGSLVRLEIRDRGPGFPAEFLERRRGGPGGAGATLSADSDGESESGLGFLLMDSLASQLRGSLVVSNAEGASLVLEFDAEGIEAGNEGAAGAGPSAAGSGAARPAGPSAAGQAARRACGRGGPAA
ncbi:MAG: cache domain-containing protein [Spirochaetaceae bacterium]|nr:cache domain-containing protein [Spirochaetaceae bacterium]